MGMLKFLAGVLTGAIIVSAAIGQVVATVDTNGVLVGYEVQKDGETICRDPMVYKEFRGPTSYIVCDWQ
jgi:hypothetical protein